MSKKNKISEQEVKKIAELSRLSLTSEELKKRTEDMNNILNYICLLYTSPSPRDATLSRMPSSA